LDRKLEVQLTTALVRTASFLPRAKYLLFGLIGLMMVVVLYKDRILLDPQASIWEHYRSFKWWLLPHGVAGALALLLGPLQFSNRLRRRFLHWHRFIGRIYVCGVGVAAPLGAWIEYIKYTHSIAPLRLLIASIGFGTLWVLLTSTGFFMAKRRNFQEHRKWMTRSYAVALVFLGVRCVEQVPLLAKIMAWLSALLEAHSISDLWMFIALSLVAADLVLRSEQMLRRRSSLKTANAAAGTTN
jgi:uncharacterized membrane protein